MSGPKLRAATELAEGDYLCVPGLDSVRFKISRISLGTPTTIISSGANLILPSQDRQVWSMKAEEVNALY
jgi:hypothetical protein